MINGRHWCKIIFEWFSLRKFDWCDIWLYMCLVFALYFESNRGMDVVSVPWPTTSWTVVVAQRYSSQARGAQSISSTLMPCKLYIFLQHLSKGTGGLLKQVIFCSIIWHILLPSLDLNWHSGCLETPLSWLVRCAAFIYLDPLSLGWGFSAEFPVFRVSDSNDWICHL